MQQILGIEDHELETSAIYLLVLLGFQTGTLAFKLVSIASREASSPGSDQRIRKATGQEILPLGAPPHISL